jgi:hypothetical protein
MTTREALHQLVDDLPDDQAELARVWLEDLRYASDDAGPPPDPETLASLDRGVADVSAGRVKSLEQYERERGLSIFSSTLRTKLKKFSTGSTARQSAVFRNRFLELAEDPSPSILAARFINTDAAHRCVNCSQRRPQCTWSMYCLYKSARWADSASPG